ncbi:MAG: hypothetical protein ACRDJH_12500 [Thermomicrobiales bacterium]
MVSQLIDALGRPLPRVRLEAYRPQVGSDLEMVVNYFWNIELSEALYPCLQTYEVALRNSIHIALTKRFENEFWFDTNILLDWQRETLEEAKNQLTTYKKPLEAGRLVAELNFGFWSSMFNRPYEEPLWHADGAHLINVTFPNLPRTLRTRKKISERVERIRRLRNRVFHYEPIWNKTDLQERHRQIHEALSWISPEMRDVMALCDRFDSVFCSKPTIEAKLLEHLEATGN